MGANQSSTISDTVNVLQQNVTDIITKNSTSSSNVSNGVQTVNVNIDNIVNCNIDITQGQVQSQNVQQIATYNSTALIQDLMKQALSQSLASSQASVNGFLSTAFTNQSTDASSVENLNSIIEQHVTNDNTTSLIAYANGIQNANLNIGTVTCPPGQPTITIDQNLVLSQYSKQVVSAMANAVMKDQMAADVINKIANTQTAQNKGLGSVLSGLMLYLLIPILIIGAIIFLPKMLGISPGQLLTNKWFIIAVIVFIILMITLIVLKKKGDL